MGAFGVHEATFVEPELKLPVYAAFRLVRAQYA